MNILITGASRGIGYATALHFAKLLPGGHLYLLSRSKDKLEELRKKLQSINPQLKVSVLPFDLQNITENDLNALSVQFPKLDILLNNAGHMVRKPFEMLSEEDWHRSYQINFFGPMKLIRALTSCMGKSTPGHIVNISTMGAVQGSVKFPGLTAYSSSKAALTNLTEILAEEYKERNIAINTLALGAVQTEMLQATFPDYKAPVTAAKMAAFIAEFCLNANHYMNGKIIPVSLSTP